MESQLPQEIINKIAQLILIKSEISLQCAKILGQAHEIPDGNFRFFSSGKMSMNMLVTHKSKKFVLKIHTLEAFQKSIIREKWLSEQKTGIVPQILKMGKGGGVMGDFYFIIQEFVPGKLLDSPDLVVNDQQIESLAQGIQNLHTIKRGNHTGFGKLDESYNGQSANIDEFMKPFEERLASSDYIDDEMKSRFAEAMKYKRSNILSYKAAPSLIHADLYPGNILVDPETNTSHVIDFGDIGWGFPERDFATLITHDWSQDNLDKFNQLVSEYEKINGGKLDPDMCDLMYIGVGIMKFEKRMKRKKVPPGISSPKIPLYDQFLIPLLEKIELEMAFGG